MYVYIWQPYTHITHVHAKFELTLKFITWINIISMSNYFLKSKQRTGVNFLILIVSNSYISDAK